MQGKCYSQSFTASGASIPTGSYSDVVALLTRALPLNPTAAGMALVALLAGILSWMVSSSLVLRVVSFHTPPRPCHRSWLIA